MTEWGDDVADPLVRIERAAESLATRVTWETGNRLGLLWIHALMGMLAGAQMLLWGSSTTIETALGIWSRPVMGGLGIVGGLFLAFGLVQKPRSIPLEVVGLLFVGLWDLAMTTGLALARIRQDEYHPMPLDQPLPDGYVSAYPITIYAGLLALVIVHLWTLRKLTRGR